MSSAEQLLGKHTRAHQALAKVTKSRDKMQRKLDEAHEEGDEEAALAALNRLVEAQDRVFDAETGLFDLKAERMAFIETLCAKRKAAEQTLAEAHSAVKIAQAGVDRFETDINRLRYP